jgi:diadenosine tetraphosphatase ApaH/serine/threonine PP2A family protein phosphatase
MDEYLESHPEPWRQRLEHIDADFVCVGHTHIPMHLRLDSLQVINPGSVGQPRDGDPRAAYAVIDRGKVEFRRVAYDIDRTLRQMRDAGIEESVIGLAESVLRRGGGSAELPADPQTAEV